MSERSIKMPRVEKKDQVGVTWLYNIFVAHHLTILLISHFTNFVVMTAYTLMFILLQFVIINTYFKLKKRDGPEVMNSLLVVEAFFCSLISAISFPSILLIMLGDSGYSVAFAAFIMISCLGMAWFFYNHHWAEFKYFVSN